MHEPYGQDLNKFVRVNNENGCLNEKYIWQSREN